ncbi:MAG: hypothetical protein ACRELD_10220 [Longimicrobiales bacterium]
MRERQTRGGEGSGLAVRCRLSPRWLRFVRGPQYDALAQDDLLRMDVMTAGDRGEPYKLCELLISRGDLLRALAAAGDPPYRVRD